MGVGVGSTVRDRQRVQRAVHDIEQWIHALV
jgi:hypothetical protein